MLMYYAAALIIATAMMVVAFLLMTSSSFEEFKNCWAKRARHVALLPIIAPTGQLLNSVEDLDMQLELWENQLDEKQKELASTKRKRDSAEDRLEKLSDISNQAKKYYAKLNAEITKSEAKNNELRSQLDDLKKIQIRLREEANENVKYCTGMLNSAEGAVATDGYETVKSSAIVPGSGLI